MDYKIIKGAAGNDELEQYRLCFEKNGSKRDISNIQWIHQKNLLGISTIYYAVNKNEIAAIYAAMPVIFHINGEEVPALQSIDTITDIDHRGKGLFPKLANKLYDDAAVNRFSLVYGFPNQNSAPGFFGKLQWTSFGEVPFLIKPLNVFYFIKKITNRKKQDDFSDGNHVFDLAEAVELNSNVTIKAVHYFNDDYDRMWRKASANIKICIQRSADYMNWRYVQKPLEHYCSYGLYENDKLQAIVVFCIKNKHGGRIGYVMELVFDPSNQKAGDKLLEFADKLFKEQKTDVVLCWCLPHSFNYRCFKQSGFYSFPPKLRPQKLFFGVRSFSDDYGSIINNLSGWYISYSDSDTV